MDSPNLALENVAIKVSCRDRGYVPCSVPPWQKGWHFSHLLREYKAKTALNGKMRDSGKAEGSLQRGLYAEPCSSFYNSHLLQSNSAFFQHVKQVLCRFPNSYSFINKPGTLRVFLVSKTSIHLAPWDSIQPERLGKKAIKTSGLLKLVAASPVLIGEQGGGERIRNHYS